MSELNRGFDRSEFEQRTERAQEMIRREEIDAIFLSTEANVRYFSGFHSQFWCSPTRPFFLVVPASGKPIAIIPEIGYSGMAATWVEDIYTWPSPRPKDDGISLLAQVLNDLPKTYGRIGVPLGAETHVRMPLNNYFALTSMVKSDFVDISDAVHRLRQIKSPAEVEKIREACRVTNIGFSKVASYARIGMSEREICRRLQIDFLSDGADACPYLIAGSGNNGYASIIMGPTNDVMEDQSILTIDTGTVWDGYFSDFNRNWGFGSVSDQAKRAHQITFDATTKGFEAAKPGVKAKDLFRVMWQVLESGGALGNNVGRIGHGLGMDLTETPSITAHDNTTLLPGMVMTLEPGMVFAPDKSMIHEENIVITENGAEWLSKRISPELTIIS